MAMRDDFAVFILTHGRADRVVTWKALDKHGYTGRRYIVIDDEDDQAPAYRKRYGKHVLQFSKSDVATRTDDGSEPNAKRNTSLWARNAICELAPTVGVKLFMQMDDDYVSFAIRFNEKRQWGNWMIRDLDRAITAMIEYFEAIPALSIAMSQAGEHLGGGAVNNNIPKRKAMNTFLLSTERPFKFRGKWNDDVNAYVTLSRQGALFLNIPAIMVSQIQTQSNPGGISDAYAEHGTYVKAFSSVMFSPSSVKVSTMHSRHARIHHRIHWPTTAAQIIEEKWRKASSDDETRPSGESRRRDDLSDQGAAL